MKIAITGHTSGIGKGLYEKLSEVHEVAGYSRSNGFCIETNQDQLIEQVKNYDIFVNNAQVRDCQTQIFNRIYNLWKNESKTIVNIGSVAKYTENDLRVSPYARSKINLNRQATLRSLSANKMVRIITVNPGHILTNMSPEQIKDKCLTVEEIVPIIIYAINLPHHIEVGEINFWKNGVKHF